MTRAQAPGLLAKIKKRLVPQNRSLYTDRAVVSLKKHGVSPNQLSQNALTVIKKLKRAGYDAFLVGGGVRDLLLGYQPKDFDVVSNATPEQVRKLFRHSRIIGRRFPIVHVCFYRDIIEVSTFRGNGNKEDADKTPSLSMIHRDNTYGTIEEDVWRRDFTVNALFYNIDNACIVDFVGGLTDIGARQIRMIGDPIQRFHEDPVRLLRAIRLAAKLDFEIEPQTQMALQQLGNLLQQVPAARLLDEVVKLFFAGSAWPTFQFLQRMGYFSLLFPLLNERLKADNEAWIYPLIEAALKSTDDRFHNQQRLTPGFLLAVFLWPVLTHHLQSMMDQGTRFHAALPLAMTHIIKSQSNACLITHRMSAMLRAMWTLQFHLEKRRKRRVYQLLGNRYFRAAFDLLALRAKVGQVPQSLVDWWQVFQTVKPEQRQQMVAEL